MKKAAVTLLQIAVTVLILAWLFRNPETNRNMLAALRNADPYWIAASIGVFALVETFAIVRWQILLRVQGVVIGWMRLASLVMIGLFFNVFMPGGTGGDVVKIFYLLKETPGKKPAAMLAVMMDRLIGLLGLIAIAGMAISLRYHWLTQTKVTSGLLYVLLLVFGGSFAFVGGSFAITSLGLVHKLPARLPFRDKLVEISLAYNLYGRAWRSSLAAFAFSLPVHICSFAQFYCVARAFPAVASKISVIDFFAIMPIVNTLSAVPVSIGGTGVREGLFIKLLGDLCGISVATATVVSLTGYLVLVIWGVAGGLLYMFYRPSDHAGLGRIEREVSELEHRVAEQGEDQGQGAAPEPAP